ncbi:hypothetical protein PVAP13_5NG008700 [Panicum virgatum]|uniref:CCHC-type domain-containing protein n=1 Tax=Panicum virgatum TaxID=38727 RepID=A0A8T0RLA2_PANVG|nr:hypothetical protein PVAP13_5NG008700 [Panicum virgatum]
MSDIAKREFDALAMDGSNYLTWATDIEIKLDSMGLDHTIVQPEAGKDERTKPDKAKALYFLRHHLHPDLKSDQQRSIVLPRAQQDWITLRFQDFKIVTKMRLCGQKITDADMIEKTLSTFHPGNIKEVLMNNHSVRPTGSMALLEAHANDAESSRNHKRGRGKGKWKGKRGAIFKGKGKGKPKGRTEPKKEKGDHSEEEQGECYRCGTKGHWSHKCRTPSHLVDLF